MVNYHLYSLSFCEVWAGAGGPLESPKPFHRLRRSPFPFRAGCRRNRFVYRLYHRERSKKASPFRSMAKSLPEFRRQRKSLYALVARFGLGVSRQTDGEVIGLRQKSVVFRSVNDNLLPRK